jgi:hypothetical protein
VIFLKLYVTAVLLSFMGGLVLGALDVHDWAEACLCTSAGLLLAGLVALALAVIWCP